MGKTEKLKSKTIWIACGGTGGHFTPGLVVGRELEALSHQVIYWGEGKAVEEKLCADHGAQLLRPNHTQRRLARFLKLQSMMSRQSKKTGRPSRCLLFGGFSSFALGCYSKLRRIPYDLFEQNAIPGRVNRLLAGGAKSIFMTFGECEGALSKKPTLHYTGNPVRKSPVCENKDIDLLILGGSQGARSLNCQLPPFLPVDKNILHICGPGRMNETREAYAKAKNERVEILESTADVPSLLARSRWVLTRAGATSLAEVAAAGVASILVPYLNARDDHQMANAKSLEGQKAAIVVTENDLLEWSKGLPKLLDQEDLRVNLGGTLKKLPIADVGGARALKTLLGE